MTQLKISITNQLRISVKDLKNYHLALLIIEHQKPLLSLDRNLNLVKGFVELKSIVDAKYKEFQGKRGNVKLNVSIPDEIQSVELNKALRWGLALTYSKDRPKREVTLLDSLAAWATANQLLPLGKGHKYHYLG